MITAMEDNDLHITTITFDMTSPLPSYSNDTTPRWKRFDWIFPVALNATLSIITIWIIFSLIHYGIKTGKWKTVRSGSVDGLSAGAVYTCTIVCAFCIVFRLISSQVAANVGFGDGLNTECEIISDILFFTYAGVLFSVVTFLWIRQRIFYANHMLQDRYSLTLRLFSAGIIVILIVAGISVVLINSIPSTYVSTTYGCIYQPPTEENRTSSWIAAAVVVVIAQLILVCLFIHPLRRNAGSWKSICSFALFKFTKKSNIPQSSTPDLHDLSTISKTTGQTSVPSTPTSTRPISDNFASNNGHNTTTTCLRSEQTKYSSSVVINTQPPTVKTLRCNQGIGGIGSNTAMLVRTIIIKTVLFAFVSVFSDVVLLVITTYVIDADGHRRISNAIYDINSFLNLMMVIFSFLSYKEMLTSPLHKNNSSGVH